ncbi:MAG: DMT family transporter [Pseudorhodobacter sp.]
MTPEPPPPRHENRPLAGLLLGFCGVVIFGGTLPATRIALEGFSPLFIMFARALIATGAAGLALIVLRRRPPLAEWRALLIVAATLVFGFPGFLNVAMQTVPAAHGGIVLGVLPLLTAGIAALIGGERPGPAFWGWSLAGAALVIAFTLRGSGMVPGPGHLWLFCAAVVTSLGYVVSGKLARTRPGWEVIAWALVLALPVTAGGTWALWDSGIGTPGQAALGAMAYLGLGSMFAGFIFWNRGLAMGGIARVGQVQLLQVFVTLAIAALLLGEALTPAMLGFAAAVAFTVWKGSRARIG